MRPSIQNLGVAAFMMIALFSARVALARDILPEYLLKAGYLYNFAILTEWPTEDNSTNLKICFYGYEDVAAALDAIGGKRVGDRVIVIRKVENSNQVHDCHMLFIATTRSHSEVLFDIVQAVAEKPVLIVTDDERLLEKRPAIFLRPAGKRLVFEVDNASVHKSSLKLSSRLLRLSHSGGSR